MSRTHKQREVVYVVPRLDAFHGQDVAIQSKLTVKEVVTSAEAAEAEVQRLNHLNRDKNVVYWWQASRFFPDGRTASYDTYEPTAPTS